jgi:type I restriction enzyme S subunit
MTDGLTAKDRAGLRSVLATHPKVRRAVLFGSRALGTFRGASDVDLALEGEDLHLQDLIALKAQIDKLNLPIEVDLVVRAKINNPELEKHIQTCGREWFRQMQNGPRMAVEPANICPTVAELPVGWLVKKLASFCTKIGTGATPRGGGGVYLDSRVNHALIRSQNVFDRHFDSTNLAFISDPHAKELRNAEVHSGDVLLNITGDGITFGRSCIVPDKVLPACVNQHVSIIRTNRKECDPGYLLSVLTHPATKSYIESFNAGGSRRAITKAHIEAFEIPLPPLAEQKAIALVLGALDDKIELNRRMNATLEAMAEALFKSWFVDATQDELPKGWCAGTLGDVADNPRRGIQPDEIKTDMAYIGLEHMPRRSIALSDWGLAEKLESGKFEFKRGEILFGKLRPYFHKVGVAPLGGVCSTDILVVTPKEPAWFGFVLGHVSSVELVNHADAASTGTKMPRANWNDISHYQVALPSRQLAADFTEKTRPLIERIIANLHESRTLATLRDALLPKLLSGELRVPVVSGKMTAAN